MRNRNTNPVEKALRQAVTEGCLAELRALPGEAELAGRYSFSQGFLERMERLIEEARRRCQARKAITFSKRAVLVFAALLVMAFGMVISVEGLRVQFFKLVSEVFEKYTAITFDKNEAVSTGSDSFVQYELSYIPKGFNVESEMCEPVTKVHYVAYSNIDGEVIDFSQESLENVSMSINTEGVSQEKMNINGCDAYYFSNIGMQSIYWYDDEYLYMVSSDLDKEVVLKMAKSIKIKNNKNSVTFWLSNLLYK